MQRNSKIVTSSIFRNKNYLSVLKGAGLKYNLIRLDRMKNIRINMVGTTFMKNEFSREKSSNL